jgi:RNA polymerase primary sigma factor
MKRSRINKKNDPIRKNIDLDPYRLYLKEVTTIPILNREEELELAHRSKNGDLQAQQRLIEANLRFVVKTARKFERPDVPILDLIDEGNIGLIEAARRFDPNRNVRFLSYAVWWIKQAIHYYLSHQSRMIPLGSRITAILYKLRKLSKSENTEMGPLNREIMSTKIGISARELEHALQLSKPVLSLDMPLNEDEGPVFGESIPQEVIPSPEQATISKERVRYVKKLMAHLTETESMVLQLRFGIGSNNRMTLREIGENLGLTRERIRQIQNKSIEKLRPIVSKDNFDHFS